MKTNYNKLKFILGAFLMALLVVSCIPEQESIGDAGQTYIKLFPAGFKLVAVNAQATTQTVVLFEVRRDPNSSAALNTTTTVVLQFDTDTAILKAYNAAHSTTFIPLDPSLASTLPALVSGKITFNFEPGVASLPLKVVIPNSAGFDFGKKYALAYKLLSISGTGVVSEAVDDEVIIQVMAKNKYHGSYGCLGYRIRPGNPTEPVDQAEDLNTTGANTVQKQGFGNYMSYYINIEITETTMVVGGTTCYKVIAIPVTAGGAVVGDMFTTFTGDPATPPAPPAVDTDINYYNPDTKQFVLNCFYFSGAGNRIMYEVLTAK
jgi:hypothetical protein